MHLCDNGIFFSDSSYDRENIKKFPTGEKNLLKLHVLNMF